MTNIPESPKVYVSVDEQFAVEFDVSIVERAALEAIRNELIEGATEAAVSITGDDELRRLNLRFRGVDRPTDVLSFGVDGAHDGRVPAADPAFATPPDERPSLGDVVISFDQARLQAERAGRPVEHELALLATHGILHLLGFDHADPDEERDMFARTDRVLEAVLGAAAMPVAPVMDALDDAGAVAGKAGD